MVKTLIAILISLTFALILSGCGDKSQAGDAATSKAKAPEHVRLGYFANLTHAQALIGVSRGDFQKAIGNVPLKTSVFNAGPSAVEAFFAGELDITYIGPGPAVNAFVKSRGDAVRVVAGAAANGVAIVARKDSGIKTLADLKGKRVATPQFANTQDIAARIFVLQTLNDKPKTDGGTTDIQPIANADQLGLFKQGQLDASWAPEPWATRLIHEGNGVLIEEEKNLWPDKRFAITLVLVSKKFLDQYPETVENLLRVNAELTAFIKSNPDQAQVLVNEELKKLAGKAVAPDVLKEAFARIEFTTDPLESSVLKFAEWNQQLGFSKEKTDVKGLFDLTLLKKIDGKK